MVHEAASTAQSNDSTPALRIENSLANEEDSTDGEGDTGTPFLEVYAHDSGVSAARARDTTRAIDTVRATANIQENTQIKEGDTSADG